MKPFDNALAYDDLNGEICRLFHWQHRRFRIRYDNLNINESKESQFINHKVVSIETPYNSPLKVIDIRGVSRLVHDNSEFLIVDNTYGSHFLQNPSKFEADIAVGSTTKYIAAPVLTGELLSQMNKIFTIRSSFKRTPLGP